jgi:acetylglutamate kinase
MYGEEYVGVRGFKKGQLETLAKIEIVEGDIAKLQSGERSDDIIVSQDAAKHFGWSVGDRAEFVLGTKKVVCYIGAIAKQSGYFLDDAPYLMLGLTENFSKLILSSENLCNEIHVVLSDKTKVDATVNAILAMDVVPVLAPLTHDKAGNMLNTNADTIAGEAAKALAKHFDVTLMFCFEKKGVLMSETDDDSVISEITPALFEKYVADGIIQGGMIPKLENSFEAIHAGVKEVVITRADLIHTKGGTIISK